MAEKKYGSTLAEVFANSARRFDGLPAFCRKDKSGAHVPVGFRELYEKGLDLATALIALGVQPRDHVGLIADNRLEWIISDYGILLAGAADVPRGSDITDAELVYILSHSDSVVVFVENSALMRRVLDHRAQLPRVREIVLMSPAEAVPEGVQRFEDLLADGAARRACGDHRLDDWGMEAGR